MRKSDDQYYCPLLNRTIFWGDCVEIDDIRHGDMDIKLFGEEFDIGKANIVCEKCKWYYSSANTTR